MRGNRWLIAGGALSAAAAGLHLSVMIGGPAWYRFFGAGEAMAQAAARGSPVPAMWCIGIAGVLSVWAAYAFAGAGLIWRLPLMRPALALISAVYLVRGLVLVPALAAWWSGRPRFGEWSTVFMVWSSLIVLVYGVTYVVGTWRMWATLARRDSA